MSNFLFGEDCEMECPKCKGDNIEAEDMGEYRGWFCQDCKHNWNIKKPKQEMNMTDKEFAYREELRINYNVNDYEYESLKKLGLINLKRGFETTEKCFAVLAGLIIKMKGDKK